MCVCKDAMFYLTCSQHSTEAFPMKATPSLLTVRIETYSSVFKRLELWQKGVKPVWNYEWHHDVTQYPGGKAFGGKKCAGTASFVTQLKGQSFIIVSKSLVETCWVWLLDLSLVVAVLTTSCTHTVGGDPLHWGCDSRISGILYRCLPSSQKSFEALYFMLFSRFIAQLLTAVYCSYQLKLHVRKHQHFFIKPFIK